MKIRPYKNEDFGATRCPFIDGDHSPMGYSQAAYDEKVRFHVVLK